MLEHLRIRDLGVIEDAELDLSPGLTVLTGETGAGKTMVVTALGLLLGARADTGAVRAGARAAVVEGRAVVPAGHPVTARLADAGGELDDDVLLVARTVSAEGRSRAHAGGRGVPLTVLSEIAAELVAVHGQHDQRRLLRPARQRDALDRFAAEEVEPLLLRHRRTWTAWRSVRAELGDLVERARERAREADLLRFGLEEIARVGPEPGEEETLRAEEARLANGEELRTGAHLAHAALLGDPGGLAGNVEADAVGLVSSARAVLEGLRRHDEALGALADRLAEASYLLADVAADLASYADTVESDPTRLGAVQDRRAAIGALLRKYGDTTAAVLEWARTGQERLARLDGTDERIATLEVEEQRLRARLVDVAAQLSRARTAAAERLSAAVTAELGALAMPHARVEVVVRQVDDPGGLAFGSRTVAHGAHGVDEVELLLVPHPGAPARPLDKGASGGELSRVMLAVEVVLAGTAPVLTFVFDEVDAGVGGRAAVEIGRRLARLARTSQVLVVTHLPQVAAFADRHLSVVKSSDGSVTRSGVVALEGDTRLRELSRMLAGLEGSATAVAHAEELLTTARCEVPG